MMYVQSADASFAVSSQYLVYSLVLGASLGISGFSPHFELVAWTPIIYEYLQYGEPRDRRWSSATHL